MLIITNAKIMTVSGENFENGSIVVENGKIKEIGNHESLLKKNECYADLVYNQIELNKSQSHCQSRIFSETRRTV